MDCKKKSFTSFFFEADCGNFFFLDTEIDWTAYMEQVTQFVKGERDYPKMEGGTGPLVYPAAHVYIYTGLYYLTNKGTDIFLAQQLFAVLYMATLGVVMLSYWKAKVSLMHDLISTGNSFTKQT